MADSPFKSIAIVGLGLIGMSLVRAIKQSPLANEYGIELHGFDPYLSAEEQQFVLAHGLDRFIDDKKTLYSADLLILAAPVEVNIALLEEIKQLAPSSTLVSDVSSTKALIAQRARELDLPFIGMHPMAGKEQKGCQESHEELLQGKRLIFCDDNNVLTSGKGAFLVRLMQSVGCTTLAMKPDEHDRIIARVSHLPQLLSTLLMQHCGDALHASGPGFATLARLSGSSWEIWRDIVATNSDNIADELEQFSQALALLANEVRACDLQHLELRFSEANCLYQHLKEMNRS